jgi:hypothetical protein
VKSSPRPSYRKGYHLPQHFTIARSGSFATVYFWSCSRTIRSPADGGVAHALHSTPPGTIEHRCFSSPKNHQNRRSVKQSPSHISSAFSMATGSSRKEESMNRNNHLTVTIRPVPDDSLTYIATFDSPVLSSTFASCSPIRLPARLRFTTLPICCTSTSADP